MSTVIRVENVSKLYPLAEGGGPISLREVLFGRRERKTRLVRALDGVSFSVREGERIGIIGRNGAGKTTLLSLLAGVAEPTSGTIEVNGRVHAMLTIGAVLRDDLTGRENIRLDAAMHGIGEAELAEHVDEIIAFSELEDFIDRPVKTYSSGMKARLAFSMGAFVHPDILILDETLAVGDVFFAQKSAQRMKEIANAGRVVIMVSHALASIVEMCDRCLWLDQGRLVMDGDPREVTAAYEKAVREADEEALRRKFANPGHAAPRHEVGRIESVRLLQEDEERTGRVRAFQPLEIEVRGMVRGAGEACNAILSLERVDGRRLWQGTPRESGLALPPEGPFRLRLRMDPFILGSGLYRLDVRLVGARGHVDAASRVFEVVDEEGQFGGVPLLLCPPEIVVRQGGRGKGERGTETS